MNSKSPQKFPFVAGSAINDPRFFVGRQDELKFIKDRMTGAQPTSVNVVGRHKIGKLLSIQNVRL